MNDFRYCQHWKLKCTIISELLDGDDRTTTIAREALAEFTSAALIDPELSLSSYYVILTIDSRRESIWIQRADGHFEACGRVLYGRILEDATGECVVVGPCGFDQCICDGDPHVMRWNYASYCSDWEVGKKG